MGKWIKLTGKLDKELVDNCTAIGVRYHAGHTAIKEETKEMLSEYDLTQVIKEYRIIF